MQLSEPPPFRSALLDSSQIAATLEARQPDEHSASWQVPEIAQPSLPPAGRLRRPRGEASKRWPSWRAEEPQGSLGRYSLGSRTIR
jgi:hypothetical protein